MLLSLIAEADENRTCGVQRGARVAEVVAVGMGECSCVEWAGGGLDVWIKASDARHGRQRRTISDSRRPVEFVKSRGGRETRRR